MSKLGKKKIQIPKDVSININGDLIDFKGPNGTNKVFINSTFFNVNYDKENLYNRSIPINNFGICTKIKYDTWCYNWKRPTK